jgi:uncharacterized protein DUF3800
MVMTFEAYFDESGHPQDPNVYVFSLIGFRAPAETWKKFNNKWGSLLVKYAAPYFHRRELFSQSSKSPYGGWSLEKKRSFLIELAETIAICLDSPRGVVKELHQTKRKSLAQLYGDSYRTCVRASLLNLKTIDRVNLILSAHKEINLKTFIEHHGLLTKAYASKNDQRLGDLCFGDFKQLPPLQAADLAAWEYARHEHHPSPLTDTMKLLLQMKQVIYR